MLFPNLELEEVVQVNDRTRLDATKTYWAKHLTMVSPLPVIKVEISPDNGTTWADVTGTKPTDWYIDFEYSSAGDKPVAVRLTVGATVVVKNYTLKVVTAAQDALFCTDAALEQEEPEVLKYVPRGRNTFLHVHREVQTKILDYFDQRGITKFGGAKIDKSVFVDVTEVQQWSKYLALEMIYGGQSNAIGDIFELKARKYGAKAVEVRERSITRLDLSGDGELQSGEGIPYSSSKLVRW